MTRRQRLEGWLSLAMLPAGIATTVTAALGGIAVVAFALSGLFGGFDRPEIAWPWAAGAFAAAGYNLMQGIATMSSFTTPPFLRSLAVSALVLAAFGWVS